MYKFIPHKELDALLDPLASHPDTFEAEALDLIERFDVENANLEVKDTQSYRRGQTTRATSFVQQFRADVDSILTMDREEEARLARRIEFARLRLEKARREEGVDPETPADDSKRKKPNLLNFEKPVSPRLTRRSMELHALRTEMVERNLYLVLINVERYAQSGASRHDLIQEGCVSLFRAVDGFDWRRGLLFRTYAVHWLNQAFRNYLYNNSHTVRVPVYLQKALKHINQATIRLGDDHATPSEIAASSDLNENLVGAAMAAARGSFSIDADLNSEGEEGSRLRDLLVDEEFEGPYSPRVEDISLEDGIKAALSELSDRERLVICMRYGVGYEREHTLAEVAQELGVSVERVRQIQVRAQSKLDTPNLRRTLDPFLDN